MDLQAGQSLAHYRILDKLGEGGMGQVYLAEDTRLKRQVALKMLPADLAGDPERRSRFEREAQAVAALNHPNIVTIYSVEEAEEIPFLTMERVDGESLTSCLQSGMSVERLFQLAIPLADAVGAAHEQGITHRDLKPDNVMVDGAGRVKVLDFGLAKLREPFATGSADSTSLPTATITAEGWIMGTAAYMSPEQAEGKSSGPASDVFSLGIILYEMASGLRPFTGDTAISTISAILHKEPKPILLQRPDLPRQLERIIRRCLAKDPTRRYSTARDLRNELEALQEEVAAGTAELGPAVAAEPATSGSVQAPGRRGGRMLAAALVVMALVAGLAAGSMWRRTGSTGSGSSAQGAPPMRFSQLTFESGVETFPALAPDGDYVLYDAVADGVWNIFMQRVGGTRPINLTGDIREDATHPAYSPDGRLVAFRSATQGGGIFVMGSTGESVRRVTDFGFDPCWSPDGKQIAFADEAVTTPGSRSALSGLWIVDVATGEERKIFDGDAVQPSWSPDGRRIAYWTYHPESQNSGRRDIHTVRIDGTDEQPVTADEPMDWNPVWSPDGRHLMFASDRDGTMNLWRVALDPDSGRALGDPQPLAMPSFDVGPFGLAAGGGGIVYASWSRQRNLMVFDLDPDQGWAAGPSRTISMGSRLADQPAPSPDGNWLVFRLLGRQEDICLSRIDGTGFRKLTDDLAKDRAPVFIPGTERIAFYSNRSGKWEIWTINMDGSGLRQITDLPDVDTYWPAFSPDGRWMSTYGPSGTLIFRMQEERLGLQDAKVVPDAPAGKILLGSWSPDGKHLAGSLFSGDEPEWYIYDLESESVRSVKFPPGLYEGTLPRWHPDGRHLIGAGPGGFTLLDLETGESRLIKSASRSSFDFRIGADGRSIFYSAGNDESDIWLATNVP